MERYEPIQCAFFADHIYCPTNRSSRRLRRGCVPAEPRLSSFVIWQKREIKLPVNNELLLNYFLTFAKFEYALKISGFFQRTAPEKIDPQKPPEAKPDWDSFANSLRDKFNLEASNEVANACTYFTDHPPNKQVIIHDNVAWETPVIPENEHIVQFLLRMIRCVRNNLFHGGKFNNEVHESTERTTLLLENSLIILNECMNHSPDLRYNSEQAAI